MSSVIHIFQNGWQTTPPDVLIEIFTHCLNDIHYPYPRINEPPLKLGRICSHWRRIVLSHSPLWSSLRVGLDECGRVVSDRSSSVLDLEALRTYLTRSRNAPLSLTLEFCSVSGRTINIDPTPFVDELISCKKRWRSLSISGPRLLLLSLLASMTQGAPLLRKLELRMQADEAVHGDPRGVPVDLRQAPQLTSLTLYGETYALVPLEAESCLVALTGLVMDYHSHIDNLISWLPYLSNLKSLDLSLGILTDANMLGDVVGQVSELPHLTDLCIGDRIDVPANTSHMTRLFNHFRASSLQRFHLEGISVTDDGIAAFGTSLSNFFQRSVPPLISLHSANYCIPLTNLVEILGLVPTLTDLDVMMDSGEDVDSVLEAMTLQFPGSSLFSDSDRNRKPILCPKLSRLVLSIDDVDNPTLEIAVNMIFSRFANVVMDTPLGIHAIHGTQLERESDTDITKQQVQRLERVWVCGLLNELKGDQRIRMLYEQGLQIDL